MLLMCHFKLTITGSEKERSWISIFITAIFHWSCSNRLKHWNDYLTEMKNWCSHRNLYTSVCSNFTPKLETTQTSFNQWTDKQTLVHPYHGLQLGNKKERTIDIHSHCDDFLENYAEWKEAIPKGFILYVSVNIKLLKWQNYKEGEQISDCQGQGQGRVGRGRRVGGKRWAWF